MENKRGSEIFLGVIGVATLVVAIIGATFAFFAAGANNTTAVTGQTASASLTLAVSRTAPTTVGNLVPQYAQYLGSAITGTGGASCIDANGNTVCHVYTITVTNGGTSTVSVDGTFDISASTITNVKWYEISSATANPGLTAGGGNAKSVTTLASGDQIAASASKTYYVVVWVEEQGENQTPDDGNKTLSGIVSFVGAGGTGVTSTFTS